MIGQVINLWNIHELWHFVCLDSQNLREKSDSHSVFRSKSILLSTATWERLSQGVIKVCFNCRIWCVSCQYCPLFTQTSEVPLKFIVNARVSSCLIPFRVNKSIPSYIDPSWINVIRKIINFSYIHKLRHLICVDIFETRVKSISNSIPCFNPILLQASTWDRTISYRVIE